MVVDAARVFDVVVVAGCKMVSAVAGWDGFLGECRYAEEGHIPETLDVLERSMPSIMGLMGNEAPLVCSDL